MAASPLDLAQRIAISPRETGLVLGVCENTVRSMVRAGVLPTVRHGRRILVPVSALRRRLDEIAEGAA